MSDKLVTVAKFAKVMEAQISQARLEAEGIHCFLDHTNHVSILGDIQVAAPFLSVHLQVYEKDLESVRPIFEEILAEQKKQRSKRGKSEEEQGCPYCGSHDLKSKSWGNVLVALALFVFMPAPSVGRKWICTKCGESWRAGYRPLPEDLEDELEGDPEEIDVPGEATEPVDPELEEALEAFRLYIEDMPLTELYEYSGDIAVDGDPVMCKIIEERINVLEQNS